MQPTPQGAAKHSGQDIHDDSQGVACRDVSASQHHWHFRLPTHLKECAIVGRGRCDRWVTPGSARSLWRLLTPVGTTHLLGSGQNLKAAGDGAHLGLTGLFSEVCTHSVLTKVYWAPRPQFTAGGFRASTLTRSTRPVAELSESARLGPLPSSDGTSDTTSWYPTGTTTWYLR